MFSLQKDISKLTEDKKEGLRQLAMTFQHFMREEIDPGHVNQAQGQAGTGRVSAVLKGMVRASRESKDDSKGKKMSQ